MRVMTQTNGVHRGLDLVASAAGQGGQVGPSDFLDDFARGFSLVPQLIGSTVQSLAPALSAVAPLLKFI